eukprot:4541216-Prymnesium_polylepis.1
MCASTSDGSPDLRSTALSAQGAEQTVSRLQVQTTISSEETVNRLPVLTTAVRMAAGVLALLLVEPHLGAVGVHHAKDLRVALLVHL